MAFFPWGGWPNTGAWGGWGGGAWGPWGGSVLPGGVPPWGKLAGGLAVPTIVPPPPQQPMVQLAGAQWPPVSDVMPQSPPQMSVFGGDFGALANPMSPVAVRPDTNTTPSSGKAPAFAVLSSERGPVLAPAETVPGMLRADWAFFLELTSYSLHGLATGSVAFGIEEVSEAVWQGVAAVVFVTVGCGHGGEQAVRRVAATGGRGYIVGLSHELHDDVAAWGSAAVLREPLQRKLWNDDEQAEQSQLGEDGQPLPKRARLRDGEALAVATPKAGMPLLQQAYKSWHQETVPLTAGEVAALAAMAPPDEAGAAANNGAEGNAAEVEAAPASPVKPMRPEDHERDLRRAIKNLGKVESLHDRAAIPTFGEAMRDRYLPALGSVAVFSALGDAFVAAKGVAHRKAMVYGSHELLMRKRGRAMAVEDRRVSCLRHFFVRIGKAIRGFKADERHAYVRLVGAWESARSFPPAELAELKEAWDVD